MAGLVHVAAAAASSLQEKVEPGLFEEKVNVALVWFVGDAGPDETVATGGVRSMVHVNDAGAETLPAGSVAVTAKVWLPAASEGYVAGLAQDAAAAASSLQEKADPVLLEEKVNVALVRFVSDGGPDETVATGGVR